LFPLTALAGSAVDVSRMYVIKTRLQQACDTAALAGRKLMTSTGGTGLDATGTNAYDTAQRFFTSNFVEGWMGSTSVSFTPVRTADGQVSGTASATIPMTLMQLFGSNTATSTVSCTARYDIVDSDVMFVLDTTGSMAKKPDDSCGTSGGDVVVTYTRPDGTTGYKKTECTGSRIAALRTAVLTFYDTLAAAQGPQTKVRYGFMPYSSAANVGYLVPSNHIVDSWTYPSREPIPGAAGDVAILTGSGGTTSYLQAPINGVSLATCNSYAVRVPVTGFTTSGTADRRTVESWTGPTGGNGICVLRVQPLKPKWRYKNVTHNTSQFKLGNTVTDPTKVTGATAKWQGCVEERQTTAASSFTSTSLPADLDPDLAATSDNTRWKPMWPEVIYYRGSNSSIDFSGSSFGPYGDSTSTSGQYSNLTTTDNLDNFLVACGKPARRLAEMTRAQVSSYVNAADFVPWGSTYHDVGMIWGTRLISPTGIFAADTAAWPSHNPPNRYIVFLTDGDMYNRGEDYGLYGIEDYDKRVSNGLGTGLETLHETRFKAVCAAAKDRGIQVYVIAFGTTLNSAMTTCASPGAAFAVTTTSGLGDIFRQIASDIAQLRLTQ
jgi:Flp pilus assembly protein TadG